MNSKQIEIYAEVYGMAVDLHSQHLKKDYYLFSICDNYKCQHRKNILNNLKEELK